MSSQKYTVYLQWDIFRSVIRAGLDLVRNFKLVITRSFPVQVGTILGCSLQLYLTYPETLVELELLRV